MLEFNAEDAMNGADVVTSAGDPARVVCIDAKELGTGNAGVVWALLQGDNFSGERMRPFNQQGVGINSDYCLKMKLQQYIKSSTARDALHRLGYRWASINGSSVQVHAEKPRFVSGAYANGVNINTFPTHIQVILPPISAFESLQKIEI